MFMIVFGIPCNFFIVLPIRLNSCRSNVFSFLASQNVRAQKIERISQVLFARVPPIGIGRAICPGLYICIKNIRLRSLATLAWSL